MSNAESVKRIYRAIVPAFLLAVGAMLPDGLAAGRALARSQLAAQLILLALLRGAWRRETGPVPPVPDLPEEQPVRAAVHSALTICGWMALFGALTNALRALAGGPLADGLLMLLDVPSGARLAASLPLGDGGKLVLLAAMCGFGGVCAGLQNLSALRGCGMSAPR